MNIQADSFTGMVMAIESIDGARALLHGPGGCRKNALALASKSFSRPKERNPEEFMKPYFYGNPRFPCTYVEADDYVMGAQKKLIDALKTVGSVNDELLVVICSSGASIIGDDISGAIKEAGLEDRCFSFDKTMEAGTVGEGFDRTIESVIEWQNAAKVPKKDKTVNLLGISVLMKDWRSAVKDLKHLLELMGIGVLCIPGAGCTLSDLKESVAASANLVVYPEYCRATAACYEKEHGIPAIVSEDGMPVGFDATESWIKKVAAHFGVSPDPALSAVNEQRRRAAICLMSSRGFSAEGEEFAVRADLSIAYPLVKWLYSYLSMVPTSVIVTDSGDAAMMSRLEAFLDKIGCRDSLGAPMPLYVKAFLGDGNSTQIEEIKGNVYRGVDICHPSIMRTDFISKPIVGPTGALYILDEIMR